MAGPKTQIERIAPVTIIDLEGGKARPAQEIRIAGEQIAAIGPASGGSRAGLLDGDGLFAIPGLIDTHVHALGVLVEDLPGPLDLPWILRQQLKNLRAFVESGVTTIRDLGAPLRLIRALRGLGARGRITAPRLLCSGPVLSIKGGYPHFLPPQSALMELIIGPLRLDVEDVTHARRVVDRLARAEVDCVKVMYQSMQYDDQRSPLPVPSRELLEAIIAHAHACRLPVAMHQIFRQDLLQVIDLPFDTLEHLPIDEPLSEEEALVIARRRVPVTTTMMTYGIVDHARRLERLLVESPGRFESKPREFLARTATALTAGEPVSQHIGQQVIRTGSTFMRQSLARLHAAGAMISYGTDSGGAITPPGNPHWELIDMSRAGLSNLDALRSATITAAAAIGRDDLGRLRPGATADLVLLRSDPLQEIEAVRHVAAVIQAGRIVHADG